jgi:hypothetical protein|tara:strand:- start:209 stop:649 length:441 start_codon:yes stop_codon:yes gene_type:complete
MKYYLDTEFNGHGGELLSLALVSEEGAMLYLVVPEPVSPLVPWVADNVWPVRHHPWEIVAPREGWGQRIASFLGGEPATIVVDWPEDIRYFCETLITGPGYMVALNNLTFQMIRVDAYPTTVEGAIQHNALCDAFALREKFKEKEF